MAKHTINSSNSVLYTKHKTKNRSPIKSLISPKFKIFYKNMLGCGTFGDVFLGQECLTEELVAIKIISKKHLNENSAILRETEILHQLRNAEGVIFLVDHFLIPLERTHVLIFEFANCGTLEDLLSKYYRLSENTCCSIFRDIVFGLKEIHSRGIIHRDLKCENVLLVKKKGEKIRAKLGDFGLACVAPIDGLVQNGCGSPLYVSPEVIGGNPYDGYKADIWSLGVILYNMVFGQYPFTNKIEGQFVEVVQDLFNEIQTTEPNFNHFKISYKLRNLLENIFKKDAKERITIEELVTHPWIQRGTRTNLKCNP